MSQEQLSALLSSLKDEVDLREKIQSSINIDAAVVVANEAGFDVSKQDWIDYQGKESLELRDEDLGGIAGGKDHGHPQDKITDSVTYNKFG